MKWVNISDHWYEARVTSKFFEDFVVGGELTKHGRNVTEADVANFAGITGDISPIHMDAVYVRATQFKR